MAQTVQSGGFLVMEPSEDWDVVFTYVGKLPTGATIANAQIFASEIVHPLESTTLAGPAAVDATSLSLTANVGPGAKLILDPDMTLTEVVKVTTISGTGPYTATIIPSLRRAHALNAVVQYEPGLSGIIIESATPTPVGETVTVHVQRLVDNERYRLSCRITTNGGRHLEDGVTLVGKDL